MRLGKYHFRENYHFVRDFGNEEETGRNEKRTTTNASVAWHKGYIVDAFEVKKIDGQAPIISHLVQIVEQINARDIESNEKLMACSRKKFENKIIEKISTTIAKHKVALQEHVQNVEELVHKIQNLYNILCDVPRFKNNF